MAKILIVDDEPRIRDLIREHLQYAGFTREKPVTVPLPQCVEPRRH
ncbi:MAG: hypothetical protein ACLUFT_11225 [Gemmiger formicilis]